MTRRITDAQEDGPIFTFRFLKCLIAPGIPVDWIVGMLEQIGARLMNEVIGVFLLHYNEANTITCMPKPPYLRFRLPDIESQESRFVFCARKIQV